MLLKVATDTVVRHLTETGLKERTIAHNYTCFYCALTKTARNNQELDEHVVSSFLVSKYSRNLMNLANCQLTRHEQTCKHAFIVLLAFQEKKLLSVRCKGSNTPLEEDSEILSEYLNFCSEAGNCPRTIQRKRDSIRRFLSFSVLQSVSSIRIKEYMQSFKGKIAYYQKRELDEVKKFLSFCAVHRYIGEDFCGIFPDIKAVKASRIPSVFTDDEVKNLLAYFAMRNSINRRRDYAIALLMAVYGFRSIDIASFNCSCLDFNNGMISFSQSKTGTMINHHILPHIGNALIDYILNERPKSVSALLFLKSDGTGLYPKSVSGIVRNGFLSSGIDIGLRRYGSHSLRHSLASRLINQGTSIFTIANVLGQTSAGTARLYAKVDLTRLSLCALEVPDHD